MVNLSFFIPVYNEEKILKRNIIKLNNVIKRLNESYEIFIVDDNSSDNTSKIAKKLVNKNKKIIYLRYNNGPSRRENLAKSFKLAKGDIIIFMDADLATDLKHTRELIQNIKDGYDISTGSIHIKGSVVKREFFRKVISHLVKYCIKIYFNSKVNDHQCGFKAFKKRIILQLVKEMGYDKKFRRKFLWDTEMLVRAQKKNYKIKEFPVK